MVLSVRAGSVVCLLAAALMAAPVIAQDAAPAPVPASSAVQDATPEAALSPGPDPSAAQATTPEAAPSPAPDSIAKDEPTPDAAQPPAAPSSAVPEAAAVPTAPPEPAMTNPRTTSFRVDWNAARTAPANLDQHPGREETAGASEPDALARLNAATAKFFPNASASRVPVLLPFDTPALLRDEAAGAAGGDDNKYLTAFRIPTFFYPGPTGYDAAFLLQPQDASGFNLTFARRVDLQISASSLIYELDGPPPDQGSPVPELEPEFPGIRRVILESQLRYIFTRFGVPYFVSIACFDGPRGSRRLSCREADQVALRFIKALNIVGGAPQDEPEKAAPAAIKRPDAASADFTYVAPGDILPGTGMHGRSGKPDTTVYSKIRFPMAHAPAYTNSQSFMNWGNCDLTGRIALGGHGRDAAYRCRVNDVPLFNDETRNYAYPWRDNFCEHRYYSVTQCPAGLGHQGEDIRPSSCKLRNEGADRCEPYQDQVVAVRDGIAWRETADEALYLIADAPDEHVRFRYLHMNPHMLDLAGMISGHVLTEGEVLGPVGDYGKREGGTTYHLHFDMQVPTRQGWLFVNPYMTLVAAYERLIGGRGQVVTTPASNAPAPNGIVSASAATGRAETDSASKSETGSEREQSGRQIAAEHCATRFVKGHRRRACWTGVAETSKRGKRPPAVRSVDRRVSRQGARARHHG